MASRPGHVEELTPLSWALAPLSVLYSFGWNAYRATYQLGLKQPVRAHPRVVCVGNLMVGGTGKTPFVVYLAGVLKHLGAFVVLSASGYGSPRATAASLAPTGTLDPVEWGDEPALLRECLPDEPIIVGRRRVLAARIAHERFPHSVLLMDDGFQHLPLAKDLSIVLDPDSPNTFALPAGPYREPRRYDDRADFVYPRDGHLIREPLVEDSSGNAISPDGVEVNVACAIARPERLLTDLRNQGFRVKDTLLMRDHDPLDDPNLFDSLDSRTPLVMTRKDMVKLRNKPSLSGREIWTADYGVHLDPEAERVLVERLREVMAKP